MKIKKNGKVINLTESDLQRIVKRVLTEGTIIDVTECFSDNGITLETLQDVPDCKKFDVDSPGRCISQLMKLDPYFKKEEQFKKIGDCIMGKARNTN